MRDLLNYILYAIRNTASVIYFVIIATAITLTIMLPFYPALHVPIFVLFSIVAAMMLGQLVKSYLSVLSDVDAELGRTSSKSTAGDVVDAYVFVLARRWRDDGVFFIGLIAAHALFLTGPWMIVNHFNSTMDLATWPIGATVGLLTPIVFGLWVVLLVVFPAWAFYLNFKEWKGSVDNI